MKKLLLVLFTIILLSGVSKAQSGKTIQNGDFENWDSTSFTDINLPWVTENSLTFPKDGISAVTKVPGKVGSAVHLQTYVKGKDTIIGTVINLGSAYSQSPAGISGYYKCHTHGKDTAFIVVEFLNSGNAIDFESFPLTTSDTTVFTSFNFKFVNTLAIAPDSMLIGAVSSNEINYVDITPGSWLELDQLAFTGTNITQQIPDGGFENWSVNSVEIPQGWQVSPPPSTGLSTGVSKSSDHYTGKYSIKMIAQPNSFGPQVSSGQFDLFGNISGGLPYTQVIDTLTGYYKYTSVNGDSGLIVILLTNQGSNVGEAGNIFNPETTWTSFEIPINASSTPDSMRIDLYASNDFSGSGQGGSILYLDDLQLKSQPHNSGINNFIKSDFGITAFPDPAQNQLNIRFGNNAPAGFGLKIYNSEGRLMIDKEFNSGSSTFSLPIDQLSAGLYFYEVNTNGSVVRNKFVKSN